MNNYQYNGNSNISETNDDQSNESSNKTDLNIPARSNSFPFGYPPMPGTFIPAGGIPIRTVMPPGLVPGIAPFAAFAPIPTGAPTAIPMNPDFTGYFGNLSPNLPEDLITAVLSCSGGFKRLKRPIDPSTAKPKPFALVEFDSVGDLNRAARLLQDFILDHRHLNIKIEGQSGPIPQGTLCEDDLKVYEGIYRVLIGKKMTGGGSMEWLEKRISQLKRERDQQRGEVQRRDSRQRNYNDLLEESPDQESQFTRSIPNQIADNVMALKERERRWEGKMKEMERDLRKDLEKDAERVKRHEKEIFVFNEYVSNYSDNFKRSFGSLGNSFVDSSSSPSVQTSFFANREKWRNSRETAKGKEEKIFEECFKIRAEIEKSLQENLTKKEENFIKNCIPIEKEELFAYPIAWENLKSSEESFKQTLSERILTFYKKKKESENILELIEILLLKKRIEPTDLIKILCRDSNFLSVTAAAEEEEEAEGEAEILVMIIWRWLIYFTTRKF